MLLFKATRPSSGICSPVVLSWILRARGLNCGNTVTWLTCCSELVCEGQGTELWPHSDLAHLLFWAGLWGPGDCTVATLWLGSPVVLSWFARARGLNCGHTIGSMARWPVYWLQGVHPQGNTALITVTHNILIIDTISGMLQLQSEKNHPTGHKVNNAFKCIRNIEWH